MSLINRRNALKSLGISSAAIVAAPLLKYGDSFASQAPLSELISNGPKVGFLIPKIQTNRFSTDFLNGIKLYLTEHRSNGGSFPFAPIVQEIGIGGVSARLGLSKLTSKHSISIAVGLMNSSVTRWLTKEVEDADIQFIETNLGENFFHQDLASERFYQNSLNLWQAHYALGEWAAKNIGKSAACVSSYYDSGYDALYGFRAGFEAAGGMVVTSLVTNDTSDTISAEEAARIIATTDVPIVFANYSGQDAPEFVSAFRNSIGNSGKKLLASGMMIQPRTLDLLGPDADGIIAAHSWDQHEAESTSFARKFKAAFGSSASDFSLLGYETAAIVTAALNGGTSLSASLADTAITSPRGVVRMDAHTHATYARVNIIEVHGNAQRTVANADISHEISHPSYRLTGELRTGALMTYPMA